MKTNRKNVNRANKDDTSGMIKYGTNPLELGDKTIKNPKELRKNVADRKIKRKKQLHKKEKE